MIEGDSSFFSISRIFLHKSDNVLSSLYPWWQILPGTFSFPNPIESLFSTGYFLNQVATFYPALQIEFCMEHPDL